MYLHLYYKYRFPFVFVSFVYYLFSFRIVYCCWVIFYSHRYIVSIWNGEKRPLATKSGTRNDTVLILPCKQSSHVKLWLQSFKKWVCMPAKLLISVIRSTYATLYLFGNDQLAGPATVLRLCPKPRSGAPQILLCSFIKGSRGVIV